MIGKISLAVLTLGVLGAGGYYANERIACSSLEEDYLNSVSALRSYALLPGDVERDPVVQPLMEAEYAKLERVIADLSDRCGAEAGRTAARKGSNMMLGLGN